MGISMNTMIIRAAILSLAACSRLLAAAPPPPLPAERLSVAVMPPANPHRVYVLDEAFFNEIDSRVHLFDGDTYRRLGQIDVGIHPGIQPLSLIGKSSVVATTYFARGSRGTRTDVVEFTDNTTLKATHEIVLPPEARDDPADLFQFGVQHGQPIFVCGLHHAGGFIRCARSREVQRHRRDRHGGMRAGDTVGSESRVVDLRERCAAHRHPGCAGTRSFARLLGDFLHPDRDPVFASGIPMTNGYAFLSFLGEVHEVDLSGAKPVFRSPWSLLGAADKSAHWRPGGMQIGAIHRHLNRLYVPMHQGGEGTHKDGGTEIWVFRSRPPISAWHAGRWRAQKLFGVLAIQVSQDDAPLLFAAADLSTLACSMPSRGSCATLKSRWDKLPG